jgi:RHS repeat-associated protein
MRRQLYMKSGANVYYEITNPHGDVVALATTNALAGTAHFDAWGNLLSTSGTTIPYGFQGSMGSWRDATTGFVSMGARWYYPKVGRFLSSDPAAGTANPRTPMAGLRWLYALDNPIRYRDPNGLKAVVSDGGGDYYCDAACQAANDAATAAADERESRQQARAEVNARASAAAVADPSPVASPTPMPVPRNRDNSPAPWWQPFGRQKDLIGSALDLGKETYKRAGEYLNGLATKATKLVEEADQAVKDFDEAAYLRNQKRVFVRGYQRGEQWVESYMRRFPGGEKQAAEFRYQAERIKNVAVRLEGQAELSVGTGTRLVRIGKVLGWGSIIFSAVASAGLQYYEDARDPALGRMPGWQRRRISP